MVGVAVNVADSPEQMLPLGDDWMETVGATAELTLTVIAFEVAVVGLAHGELEVSTTVITSLFAKVVVVNVLLLVPTFVVPFFH